MIRGIVRLALTALVSASLGSNAMAAEFTSGSTGADGALDVIEDTVIPLPPDGILHCTSVTIRADQQLSFQRNANNTPVFILSQGDVVFENNAVIRITGEQGQANGVGGAGGPGGFAGGSHVDINQRGGAGFGPGAGTPGPDPISWGRSASYGAAGSTTYGPPGPTYGSQLLMPLVGGSGGAAGNGYGGGGGGGAILIASDTRIAMGDNSRILAFGEGSTSGPGDGSGGAVRFIAPVVEGTGRFDVAGGGAGRTRIDTLTTDNMNITVTPVSAPFSVGSMMVVFMDIQPRIDILGVGQQSIPLGHDGEFLVVLPSGSGSAQDVTVQLSSFTGQVPIRMTLTPEAGEALTYDVTVDMSDAVDGVKSVDITGDFPLNVPTVVNVWTVPPPETP